MRVVVYSMVFLTLCAPQGVAGELPAALKKLFTQGVQACVNYYTTNASIVALEKYGFAGQSKSVALTLSPPDVTRKVTVETLIEGPGDIECEVHANYERPDTQKHAFNILLSTMSQNGFKRLREHHYSSKAKTIYTKGNTSVFTLIRAKRGKMMIKFKRRAL
jgi:hypothetical protein